MADVDFEAREDDMLDTMQEEPRGGRSASTKQQKVSGAVGSWT